MARRYLVGRGGYDIRGCFDDLDRELEAGLDLRLILYLLTNL